MNTSQIFLLCLCGAFFLVVALIAAIGDAYSIEEKSERKVQYADSREVEAAVLKKFPPKPIPIEFSPEFEDMDKENALSKKRAPKTRSIT